MQKSDELNKITFFNQVKYLDANFNQILLKLIFFCSIHKNIQKWCMYSDYSFEKANKTITFVIVPAEKYLEALNSLIKKVLPKDMKHTRSIDEEKRKLLTSNFFFSISFILENENKMIKNISKELIVDYLNLIISNKSININDETKDKINLIIKDTKKKNFNKKLFHRITTTTYLAAYVEYKFIESFKGKLEAFGWFSDRDVITTAYKVIYSLFYSINRNNFLEYIENELPLRYIFAQPLDIKKYLISLPAPEIFNEKELFYDSYNRIADYICATIADYNMKKSIVSHKKFINMLEYVLTHPNHNIININYNKISNIKILYSEERKILSKKINKISKILEKYNNGSFCNSKRIKFLKELQIHYKNEYDNCIK